MLAKSIERLPPPHAGGYRYEPKLDGYRALAYIAENHAVRIDSRRGTSLSEAFPEIVGALYAYLPAGTVVDGEIVRWNRGRLDFAGLQRRYANRRQAGELAAAEPAHLVLFDVLETARHGDLRRTQLVERRRILTELMRRVPGKCPLALSMQTADPDLAQDWYDQMAAVGVEGLVIKPATGLYLPGTRSWMKYKTRRTTDALVGGVTGTLRRPEALLLGRYASDTGRLHYAGRTTHLTDAQAAIVAHLLTPAGTEHPWPEQLTVNCRSKPTRYLQVEPTLVVEIHADVATDQGRRWRHAVRMVRVRDIAPAEVPLDLDLET